MEEEEISTIQRQLVTSGHLGPGPGLREKRFGHVSWDSPSGMFLIGGLKTKKTSEPVKTDGMALWRRVFASYITQGKTAATN